MNNVPSEEMEGILWQDPKEQLLKTTQDHTQRRD